MALVLERWHAEERSAPAVFWEDDWLADIMLSCEKERDREEQPRRSRRFQDRDRTGRRQTEREGVVGEGVAAKRPRDLDCEKMSVTVIQDDNASSCQPPPKETPRSPTAWLPSGDPDHDYQTNQINCQPVKTETFHHASTPHHLAIDLRPAAALVPSAGRLTGGDSPWHASLPLTLC